MSSPPKFMQAWKLIKCDTCGAAPGDPCGRHPFGVPWGWERVSPHVARQRAARIAGVVPMPLPERRRAVGEILGKCLGNIIKTLEQFPREKRVPLGWGYGSAHSYRGYYDDLAFTPKRDVTVGEMLDEARSAIGKTFRGWKGGDYKMNTYTTCWLADAGDSSGDGLGPCMMALLLGALDDLEVSR